MKEYPIHPAAALIPKPSAADFERLKVSIATHRDVIEPIKLLDGMILDGVSRYRACRELEIECPTLALHPDELEGWTPEEWVVAANVARRQLTKAQLAAIAAQQLVGSARRPKEEPVPKSDREAVFNKLPKGRAAERAAKAVGVHRDSVHRAAAIQKKNPAAFERVAAGEMSLAEAEADVILDGEGNAVTRESLQPAFRARAKLVEATKHLIRAMTLLKAVFRDRDGADNLEFANIGQKIGYARSKLVDDMPHIMCPSCEGICSDQCERCTNRGWQSKAELHLAELDERGAP